MEILFPEPFLKNQNWAYLWINSLKFYSFCFYCKPSWGLSKYAETKLQTICFYLMQTLKKIKKRSETGLPGSFSAWLLKKSFPYYILLTKFHFLIAFTFWYWVAGVLQMFVNQVAMSEILKLTLYSYMTKTPKNRFKYFENEKIF